MSAHRNTRGDPSFKSMSGPGWSRFALFVIVAVVVSLAFIVVSGG